MKSTKKVLKKQKEELKSKMDEIISSLKDKGVKEDDINELLSIKGQMDIEPTRIHIKEKDVVKEYDMGAFRFVRCKSCIIFQDKGGLTLIVNPRMSALYEHLDNLLNLKENYDSLDDSMKKVYDSLITSTVYVLNLPIYATCDDEMFFGIASDIVKRLSDMVDKFKKENLKEETYKENAEFENRNEALEEVFKEDKDA